MKNANHNARPLGVGLGFRVELAEQLEENIEQIDFLEFVGDHCIHPALLLQAKTFAEKVPNVCHFLNLSIGTDEPLDRAYLRKIDRIVHELKPRWVSDHLAVTRVQGIEIGHLSPVAFTEETVELVSKKVAYLQEHFQLPFLLENITYHFKIPGSTLKEWELLRQVVEKADCGILLDLNNVCVNAKNQGYDEYDFLAGIPLERVMQVHIAGGTMADDGTLIDSHDQPVPDRVFELLSYVCDRSPISGILLERDKNMPPFEELAVELQRARSILQRRRGVLST